MKITLTRFYDDGETTLGRLRIETEYQPPFNQYNTIYNFFTVEPPWKDNQKNISCIPTGKYIMKPIKHDNFGKCFYIENVPNRGGIITHAGNTYLDTRGCILAGNKIEKRIYNRKHSEHNIGVINSKKTMKKLVAMIIKPTEIEIFNDEKLLSKLDEKLAG